MLEMAGKIIKKSLKNQILKVFIEMKNEINY